MFFIFVANSCGGDVTVVFGYLCNRDVLNEGGSAVDAAIATLFCVGIHCAHSAGIGGGFFMVVHSMQVASSTLSICLIH